MNEDEANNEKDVSDVEMQDEYQSFNSNIPIGNKEVFKYSYNLIQYIMNGSKLSNSFYFKNISKYSLNTTRFYARRYLIQLYYNFVVYKKMSNVKYECRIAQYNNMNIVEVDDNEFEKELKEISS